MQPLSKTMRRRLRGLSRTLTEADIDRFEQERDAAMQAALCEDPLYAAALSAEPGAAPTRAEPGPILHKVGTLLQRAVKADRQTLDRKCERVLARQAEAARPKRPLGRGGGGR